MTPGVFIDRALHVPHVPGGGSWTGADCWGIVELYYREVLNREVVDRDTLVPGCESVEVGWSRAAERWRSSQTPEDHCLVVMRAGALRAGHVGVFYAGSILHSRARHGCVFQPVSRLRRVLTDYLLIRGDE